MPTLEEGSEPDPLRVETLAKGRSDRDAAPELIEAIRLSSRVPAMILTSLVHWVASIRAVHRRLSNPSFTRLSSSICQLISVVAAESDSRNIVIGHPPASVPGSTVAPANAARTGVESTP